MGSMGTVGMLAVVRANRSRMDRARHWASGQSPGKLSFVQKNKTLAESRKEKKHFVIMVRQKSFRSQTPNHKSNSRPLSFVFKMGSPVEIGFRFPRMVSRIR